MRTRGGPDPLATRGIARRIVIAAAVLAAGFVTVACRAVQLQVLRSEDLSSMARDQYDRELELKPRRGPILDRNGVTLAADVEADSVFVDPEEFGARAKPGDVARLARALGVERSAIEKRLQRGGRFGWLKRRISPAESAAVRTMKIPGIGFVKEFRRYYPSRDLAGQILGGVGESGEGSEGLEKLFDDKLRGTPVRIASLRDARGRLSLGAPPVPDEALVGGRVELAIDQGLQAVAEQALAKAVERARAKAGMLVAIDPATGEILALANAPLYNPNSPKRTSELMKNRAVLDTFEPGSTMKAFTLAGALDAGVLKEDDAIDCEMGRLRIGKHVIHDHHGLAWVGPARILASSSNIGSAKIGQRLGRERLRETLLGFGFGERPGLGLPGEPRGQVPLPRADIALATMSFGQGVTASPLQVTAAMAALANGGMLMKPILVRRVVERKGTERGAEDRVAYEAQAAPIRRAVSARTAATLTRWLEGVVVEKEGTGKKARLEHWRAAGKTGTAQKVDPVTKTYSRERFSSFVGFAPVDAPRIAIGVFIDEPKGEVYGGELGAPVFREVAEWAMKSFGVPPTAPLVAAAEPERAPSPAPAGGEAPPVIETAPERPIAPGSVAVPGVEGLPARFAIRKLEQAELLGEVAGTGRVSSQSPRSGQVVRRGTTVRITLAPPGE
jgi:cell division protein FtsI (penicillin-binding protein 3)